jgi:Zn-dependent M16 (insulinase) family peptidase
MFREITGGLSYYWFVSDLLRNFDTLYPQISANLKQVASLLFNWNNLTVSVSCAKKDLGSCQSGLDQLVRQLTQGDAVPQVWDFTMKNLNEGILAASNVQYIVKGSDFKKLGYQWNGKMRVLNQILSTDWLQTRIRVIGGAYGGFSSISPNGTLTFSSYRDPNLSGTIDNFNETAGYLSTFAADDQSMARYIIGTIADLDAPLTPSQKGEHATTLFLSQRTHEELQLERDAVLSTTQEDIRNFKSLVTSVMAQNVICAYGNADQLTADQSLFQNLIRIEQV